MPSPSTPLTLQQALDRAVAQLLRPLCRVLLRLGMSFSAFEALAKRVYVDVALHEFGLPGKKPSISRVSILSGLTRKDVQRLVQEPLVPSLVHGAEADPQEPVNRAARVLTGWVRDAAFHDAAGQPSALALQGEPPNFSDLVRRHSGDMPVRAMLDELLRVGSVRQRHDDGLLELVQHGYVPRSDATAKLVFLGGDVADLIATIDHNLQHGAEAPRYQRRVMYDAIPVDCLPEFRRLSAEHAQALLVMLDRWLDAHERDSLPPPSPPSFPAAQTPAVATVRVGLGIYYFEDSALPVGEPGVLP